MIVEQENSYKSCALSSVYNKSYLGPHSFGATADCPSQNTSTVVAVDYRKKTHEVKEENSDEMSYKTEAHES